MCCEGKMSAAEEVAVEESFSIYCKPLEFYNALQCHSMTNPVFRQRCLQYKIEEKCKRRIQLKISYSGVPDGSQIQYLFPLYIFLARRMANFSVGVENSAVYRFSQAGVLSASNGAEGINCDLSHFDLPEINKIAKEVKSGSLAILFVSCAQMANSGSVIYPIKNHNYMTFPSKLEGQCLLGRIPMESLYMSWEKSPNLSLGGTTEMRSTVDMHSYFMKLSCMDKDKFIEFQMPSGTGAVNTPQQVEIIISAKELWAKDKSAYQSYSSNDVPTSSSRIVRLRNGNVNFNYRYYNNKFYKTEVTEDFSCPFCLVKCASFKGLKHHLSASHDLFNFEFRVTEEYQAVDVSIKTDACQPQIVPDGADPKHQTFYFCSKTRRCRKSKILFQHAKVDSFNLNYEYIPEINELQGNTDGVAASAVYGAASHIVPVAAAATAGSIDVEVLSATAAPTDPEVLGATAACPMDPNALAATAGPIIPEDLAATAEPYEEPECVNPESESNLSPPRMTRQLSVEHSNPRNSALLENREFFHSHGYQRMELDEVFPDQDSEDEGDVEVKHIEDKWRIGEFVDITEDEKQIMILWNDFVRRQRVLADGHVPWVCEEFSRFHGQDLVRRPQQLRYWRLFLIRLWDHNLIDPKTINKCNLILDEYRDKAPAPAGS